MQYTCPMHPEAVSDQPGNCPKCGMRLVSKEETSHHVHQEQNENYLPLFIIIFLILVSVAAIAIKDYINNAFNWPDLMYNFMAGFFLVFSGFKFLDLRGFAEGYSTYDLLARKVFGYGYVYPFLELAFGLAYLTGFNLEFTNYAVLIVMILAVLGFYKVCLSIVI